MHFVQDTFFTKKLEAFNFKNDLNYFFLLIDVSRETFAEKTLSMCVVMRIHLYVNFSFQSNKLTKFKPLLTIENWYSLIFMVWENIFPLKRNFISFIINLNEYIRIMIFLECNRNNLWWFWKGNVLRCTRIDKLTSPQHVDGVMV